MSNAATRRFIDVRRRQESAYQEMAALVSEDKRQSQVVNFEITSASKIERKLRKEDETKLKNHEQELLNDRRQRLAKLYEDDMEMWKAEALSKVETQEDRKKRFVDVIIKCFDTK